MLEQINLYLLNLSYELNADNTLNEAKIIGYKIVYKKSYNIDKSRNLTKSFSIE